MYFHPKNVHWHISYVRYAYATLLIFEIVLNNKNDFFQSMILELSSIMKK